MPLKIKDHLTIGDVDKDGDIEISIESANREIYCYLDQKEIKDLIEHLQNQLKHDKR